MGRSVLILVGAAAIFGSYSLMSGAGTSATRSAQLVSEHGERVLAREIAVSAHAATLTAVRNDLAAGAFSGSKQLQGSYQGGTFVSSAEVVGDTLEVVTRATRRATSYVVRATYLMGGAATGAGDQVPDFMRFGLLVESNLTLTGNSRVFGSPGANANVHTNGRLTARGNALVHGFGTHVTGANGNAGRHFQPIDNPDGLAPVRQGARITIPEFDPTEHRARATVVTHGNLNLRSTQLGTKDNPVIWHVTGNLSASGNVTLSGYGVFVVEGNVTINGNVTSTGGQAGTSNIAFYSARDVRLNGNATLHGQIFAGRNLIMNGNATLHGSATARGRAQLSGNFSIHYRSASPALTAPIWPPDEGGAPYVLALIDYREGG